MNVENRSESRSVFHALQTQSAGYGDTENLICELKTPHGAIPKSFPIIRLFGTIQPYKSGHVVCCLSID